MTLPNSLRARLILIFTFTSLINLLVGALSFYNLKEVSAKYNHVATVNLIRTRETNNMLSTLRQIRIGLRSIVMPKISREEVQDELDKSETGIATYDENIKDYLKIEYSHGQLFGPEEKELFNSVETAWNNYKEVAQQVIKLHKIGGLESEQKTLEIFHGPDPLKAKQLASTLQKLIAYQSSEAGKWISAADSRATLATWIMLITITFGITLSMTIGLVYSGRISKMIVDLAEQLQNGTDQVSEVAEKVASASSKVSGNVISQSSAIEETVASVEETRAMIAKNTENARQSAQLSEKSQETVEEAGQIANEVVQAITEIAESNKTIITQINQTNSEISDMVKIVSDIGIKTKVIDEIVFQTKLLSFNASVEAARAGEHGKGFAVVAEEVGNLAAMSGKAASEINVMVNESIQKIRQSSEQSQAKIQSLVEAARQKLQNGSSSAERCNKILGSVVQNVSQVNQRMGEISSASMEQDQGVQNINKAMLSLGNASNENRTSSEQTSQSAEQLKQQVVDLRESVEKLNHIVLGDH